MQIRELKPTELEEVFQRSSGPGGQNVNKTSTKVTLRHLPTGLTVTVQDTRSQAKNRELARERLLQLLNERATQQKAAVVAARERERRRKRKRPPGLKARILSDKKKRGEIKRQRTQTKWD